MTSSSHHHESMHQHPFKQGGEAGYTYPDHSLPLSVMSWNIWKGGSEVDNALKKQSDVIRQSLVEILFLQECSGDAAVRLAHELGMTVAQQGFDCAILSAYPMHRLKTRTEPYATAALIETRQGDVLAWSIHLAPWDYGPYMTDELINRPEEVFAQTGEQMRTKQAQTILEETERLLKELQISVPVIVAGDFNVPSGEDWQGDIRPVVQWPATQTFIDAGYQDAFRHCHPEISKAPGLSWSHIEPLSNEPRDRIDFIYIKGGSAISADHIGSATDSDYASKDAGFYEYGGVVNLIPNHRENAFPSDHLAVRASILLSNQN